MKKFLFLAVLLTGCDGPGPYGEKATTPKATVIGDTPLGWVYKLVDPDTGATIYVYEKTGSGGAGITAFPAASK